MKPILIIISESEGADDRNLEAARVAAGLAQLSDLKVHLLLRTPATGLLQNAPGRFREYLKLLQDANGRILVPENSPPTAPAITRCPEKELLRLEKSIAVRIEI